ncbi:zona pellucida sperm-binding protein 3-like [Centropristis striata]|uniref:zona pellucida sperm-binding protein 3-like n=1 Tax=Centropristis striata TaxID=184440 RepID=UPI0027E20755|nr:zona pellucida sperm-binding protein 3-like [Centropristis striata]
MMVHAGHSASLALLISFAFGVADAIRTLKDGPMIDAEGREYKSVPLRTETESAPEFYDGSPVRVQCTETYMVIVVKADLYKNGRLLSPEELLLGGVDQSQDSQCRVAATSDSEYVIEAELQNCGSKLTISEDSVIYSNKLIISPTTSYHGITRKAHSVVPVSCYYKRTQLVSSSSQQPALSLPTPAQLPAADFSLKLMTDDWTGERFSSVFHLGDLLHLEASYSGPDSGQRRLFIDSCVATLSPDASSLPRYYFIDNHGCCADAAEGASNSLFTPRTRASSLQLQLDAFLFHHHPRNSIFITCYLKATSEMWRSSPVNKACNYIHSRWMNVDGSDDVCRCCGSSCYKSSPNDQTHLRRVIPEDIVACGAVTLGPLMVFPSK